MQERKVFLFGLIAVTFIIGSLLKGLNMHLDLQLARELYQINTQNLVVIKLLGIQL